MLSCFNVQHPQYQNMIVMGPVAGNEGSVRILLLITTSLLLYSSLYHHHYIPITISLPTTISSLLYRFSSLLCRVNMAISLWIFCSPGVQSCIYNNYCLAPILCYQFYITGFVLLVLYRGSISWFYIVLALSCWSYCAFVSSDRGNFV